MRGPLFGLVNAAIRLFGHERRNGVAWGAARSSTRIGYRLIIDGPVVVADYESSNPKFDYCVDRIVGGHVREALVKTFTKSENDFNDSMYDRAVFSDALWATADLPFRTVPMPLSIAVAKVGADLCVVDAAACVDAEFIAMEGEPKVLTMEQFESLHKTGNVGHIIYRPSWKDQHKEAAEQVFSKAWKVPNAESQRLKLSAFMAKNSRQLPSGENETSHQYAWLGDIDLSGVSAPQRAFVLKRLKLMLRSNEIRLGKSKTPVRFELCAQAHKRAVSLPQGHEPVRLLLMSAAPILPTSVAAGGANSFSKLQKHYQEYFSYASNGLLQLSTYFASQRMAGGEEYQRHFRNNKLHYRPELLTEEGSVFVLSRSATATDAEIAKLLQDWSDCGLPNTEERASHTWRNHPFVRENGYSEVCVNHPVITPTVATAEHRRTR